MVQYCRLLNYAVDSTFFMKLSDTFLPSAGVVGLLPMVTYFILVWAMYAFLATFLFTSMTLSTVRSEYRISYVISAMMSAVAGFSYFLIQSAYRDVLAELTTLTDAGNQQVLIRESYNLLSAFRYMGWAVTIPLLVVQTTFVTNRPVREVRKPLTILLLASVFMVLTSYIGGQQLGFDHEIQTGPKLIWGVLSIIGYVVVGTFLRRGWTQTEGRAASEVQRTYRLMASSIVTVLGIYQVGYWLTLVPIDFNWIQITISIVDLVSIIGATLVLYWVARKET